jgi:hypothetical protein
VPGATVTLRSLDDNSVRTSTVAVDGAFEFVNLKPGRYSLSAQATGFADVLVSSAQLDARHIDPPIFDCGLVHLTRPDICSICRVVPLIELW